MPSGLMPIAAMLLLPLKPPRPGLRASITRCGRKSAHLFWGLGKRKAKRHVKGLGELHMPLPHFLLMLATVITAAGATIALATWAELPMAALAFGALAASLILGLRQWR